MSAAAISALMRRVTPGAAVCIDGKRYTVATVMEMGLRLYGPRGGEVLLIINVHSGRASLVTDRGSTPVTSARLVGAGQARPRRRRRERSRAPAAAPAAPSAPIFEEYLASSREYRAAQRESEEASARRAALPAGSTRARVTTANARWARKAEHRDRVRDRLRAEWEGR